MGWSSGSVSCATSIRGGWYVWIMDIGLEEERSRPGCGESWPMVLLVLYGRGEVVAAGVMYVCDGSWMYMESIFDPGTGVGEKGPPCASRLLVKWPMNNETMHFDVRKPKDPAIAGSGELTPIASTHLDGSGRRTRSQQRISQQYSWCPSREGEAEGRASGRCR